MSCLHVGGGIDPYVVLQYRTQERKSSVARGMFKQHKYKGYRFLIVQVLVSHTIMLALLVLFWSFLGNTKKNTMNFHRH